MLRVALQADDAAGRAGGALVQPVAVGVEAVLDVLRVDLNLVLLGDGPGALPGVHLQPHQLEVAAVGAVAQIGVPDLV